MNSLKSTSPLPSSSNISEKGKSSNTKKGTFLEIPTYHSLHQRVLLKFWQWHEFIDTQASRVVQVKLLKSAKWIHSVYPFNWQVFLREENCRWSILASSPDVWSPLHQRWRTCQEVERLRSPWCRPSVAQMFRVNVKQPLPLVLRSESAAEVWSIEGRSAGAQKWGEPDCACACCHLADKLE